MTNKREKVNSVLLYAVTLMVLGLSVWAFRTEFSNRGVAYIDIGKLVNNYKFKKELENAASQNLYKIKGVMDSLQMIKKVSGETPMVDSQLAYAQAAFNEYYQRSNEQISKKIWERLNPLVEQFGKEKGVKLLIGANGTGTVLYGDKNNDMTDDLANYINMKYEKGN